MFEAVCIFSQLRSQPQARNRAEESTPVRLRVGSMRGRLLVLWRCLLRWLLGRLCSRLCRLLLGIGLLGGRGRVLRLCVPLFKAGRLLLLAAVARAGLRLAVRLHASQQHSVGVRLVLVQQALVKSCTMSITRIPAQIWQSSSGFEALCTRSLRT